MERPMVRGAPTWKWAADMVLYVGTQRGWDDDRTLALAAWVEGVQLPVDAPASWDAVAAQVDGLDEVAFPGADALAASVRSGGVESKRRAEAAEAAKLSTQVKGAAEMSAADAGAIATAGGTVLRQLRRPGVLAALALLLGGLFVARR